MTITRTEEQNYSSLSYRNYVIIVKAGTTDF